ncbi:hypothetical protein GCM10029992_33650 [Glycomyces albus]
MVLLGEQGFSGRFDHVLMPNEDGAKAATLHLIDRGCERIAFLGAGELDRVSVASAASGATWPPSPSAASSPTRT